MKLGSRGFIVLRAVSEANAVFPKEEWLNGWFDVFLCILEVVEDVKE